jgi:hypothetical protein
MSLLDLQGMEVPTTERGHEPPPGSRASRGCNSTLSILC